MQNNTYPNVTSFGKQVSGANTATKLFSTNTPCKKVDIQAINADIWIGDSTIDGTKGNFIPQGSSITLYVEDLSKFYIYSTDASGTAVGNYYF